MFISVDGKAREVKEVFAGGTDGLAHKINEIYGSVDGVAKLVYSNAKREPNAFDNLTWAQIKELADNGLLLDHFKKGDLVDIKFKEPIDVIINRTARKEHIIQDIMTMQVDEVTENGMRLVAYTAVPLSYTFTLDNNLFQGDLQDTNAKPGQTHWASHKYWGLCGSLYEVCKEIDNRLPDDMREALFDYSPCYIYENYIDHEGKKRFREVYDDCRVHQVTTCGYRYHKEFVEENNRNEYILDFTHYPRTEQKYKKYFTEELRKDSLYNDVRCGVSWCYYQYANNAGGYWRYRYLWDDPDNSWDWDWENYDGWNELGLIDNPWRIQNYTFTSAFVPEVIIGTLDNDVLKFDQWNQPKDPIQ